MKLALLALLVAVTGSAPNVIPAAPTYINQERADTSRLWWVDLGGGSQPDLSVRSLISRRVSATWYCKPGRSICTRGYPASGLYAAAGSALRVGKWRGRLITVCLADRRSACVVARLIDWCACQGVDLYAGAFARLAPLSRGRVSVVVTWR